jgi:hypothetical protein
MAPDEFLVGKKGRDKNTVISGWITFIRGIQIILTLAIISLTILGTVSLIGAQGEVKATVCDFNCDIVAK